MVHYCPSSSRLVVVHLLVYNKLPIYSAWWVITRVRNLHLRALTEVRVSPPSESNIHDTFSTGIQHVFMAVFQLALSFSKWRKDLSKATFMERFCRLLRPPLCCCIFVLRRSLVGVIDVLLVLKFCWRSVDARLLVTVTTLVHTWCVFLLWSFLMAEIRPKLCSLLLGILCHMSPERPDYSLPLHH